jgi:ankyrin repeat protein
MSNFGGHGELHNICKQINSTPLGQFQRAIRFGANLNLQNELGDTPLHYALLHVYPDHDGEEIIHFLLQQAHINGKIQSCCGQNLLHAAAQNLSNLSPCVFQKLALTHGADINACDGNGATPLHYALKAIKSVQDLPSVFNLLTLPNVRTNVLTLYHQTYLHSAAQNVINVPFVVFRYLIFELKIDIFTLDRYHKTALELAAANFNRDCDRNILDLMLLCIGISGDYSSEIYTHSVFAVGDQRTPKRNPRFVQDRLTLQLNYPCELLSFCIEHNLFKDEFSTQRMLTFFCNSIITTHLTISEDSIITEHLTISEDSINAISKICDEFRIPYRYIDDGFRGHLYLHKLVQKKPAECGGYNVDFDRQIAEVVEFLVCNNVLDLLACLD